MSRKFLENINGNYHQNVLNILENVLKTLEKFSKNCDKTYSGFV